MNSLDDFTLQRLKSIEEATNRLTDASLTLSASILGFSVVFLGRENIRFVDVELLQSSWIALAISMVMAIIARVAAFRHDVIFAAAYIVWAQHEKAGPLPGMKELSLFRRIRMYSTAAALIGLGTGLSLLLAFGFVNVD